MPKFRTIVSIVLIIGSFLLSVWLVNTSRFISLALLMIGLLLLWWGLDVFSRQKLRESFFRNADVPYRNLIGLSLGATASLLPLTSGAATTLWATWVFLISLGLTIVLLVAVRPRVEKELDRFAWGLLVIIVFGFGLGALVYQSRSWWIWLWRQYIKINEPHELVLEFLFILGVILGVFMVRNWAKEQTAFTESLSGILGGTFVAAVFGESLKDQGLTPMRALTYYGLGFVMSAAINLLLAARLTANYVNKRSITSRAILDFLYGDERTKLIDGYFLKNFKADPDYAKEWLTDTLNQYRELAAREFATRIEKRRKERERFREDFKKAIPTIWAALSQKFPQEFPAIKLDQPKAKLLKELIEQRRKWEPACAKRVAIEEKLEELKYKRDSMGAVPESMTESQEKRLQVIKKEIDSTKEKLERAIKKCDDTTIAEWRKLAQSLNQLKPSYFYQLIAIECEAEDDDETKDESSQVSEKDRTYMVIYKYLGSNESSDEDAGATDKQQGAEPSFITEHMFRVGIAARWQDLLEYIAAPGEYRASFPYFGSVSGLALMFRHTIIMDCDRYRRFRNKQYVDGICPAEIEQARGLDEIDFLSYVAMPMVSRLGSPTENGVGVVTIDSKLFVSPFRLEGHPVKASEGIFSTPLTPNQLTKFASNLYEPDDRDVAHIAEITKIIVPVVELYNKCRVGAT